MVNENKLEENIEILNIKGFSMVTNKAENFLKEIEEICKKYSLGNDFFFKYEII